MDERGRIDLGALFTILQHPVSFRHSCFIFRINEAEQPLLRKYIDLFFKCCTAVIVMMIFFINSCTSIFCLVNIHFTCLFLGTSGARRFGFKVNIQLYFSFLVHCHILSTFFFLTCNRISDNVEQLRAEAKARVKFEVNHS